MTDEPPDRIHQQAVEDVEKLLDRPGLRHLVQLAEHLADRTDQNAEPAPG